VYLIKVTVFWQFKYFEKKDLFEHTLQIIYEANYHVVNVSYDTGFHRTHGFDSWTFSDAYPYT